MGAYSCRVPIHVGCLFSYGCLLSGHGGGGGACPQTPLDKCALHTKHPEPETVAS